MALKPKEAQNLALTRNYQPVSLLIHDYKLFTMFLVKRLKKKDFIHEDQYGFFFT